MPNPPTKKPPKKFIKPGRWYSEFDENGRPENIYYSPDYYRLRGIDIPPEGVETDPEKAMAAWKSSIFEGDAELLEKHTAEVFAKHPEGLDYDIEYRLNTKWGYRWVHEYGICTRREDGSLARIDSIMFDIDEPFKKNTVYCRFVQEYFSVNIVDFDENTIQVIKASPYYNRGDPGTSLPYAPTILELAASLEGEARRFFEQIADPAFVQEALKTDDKHTFTYQSTHKGIENTWITASAHLVSRRDDGSVRQFTLAFSFTDPAAVKNIELHNLLKENLEIIQALAADYSAVFYIDVATGKTIPCAVHDESRDYVEKTFVKYPAYQEGLKAYVENYVYEADREKVLAESRPETVRDHLLQDKSYTVTYRSVHHGDIVFTEMRFVNTDSKPSVIKHVALGFVYKDEEIMAKFLNEKLAGEYLSAFLVDLSRDTYRTYRVTDTTSALHRGDNCWSLGITDLLPEADDRYTELIQKLADPAFLKKDLTGIDRREYVYRRKEGEHPWRRMVALVIDRDGEEPRNVLVTFEALDRYHAKIHEQQLQLTAQGEKLARRTAISNYFINLYTSAYYCSLDTGNFVLLHSDEATAAMVQKARESWHGVLETYTEKYVHKDDREKMLFYLSKDYIRKKLETDAEYSFTYREVINGKTSTFRCSVIKGEDTSHAAVGFSDITEQIEEERKLQEKLALAEDYQKLVSRVAERYNVAFQVSLSDASYTTLKMGKNAHGAGIAFKDFTAAREYFITNIVYAPDREKMRDALDFAAVRERLAAEPEYNIEYRTLTDDIPVWNVMTITLIDEDHVAVGFVNRDRDILNAHIRNGLANMYEGIYVVNLDVNMLKVIKAFGAMVGEPEVANYSQVLKMFAAGLSGEAKAYFLKLADPEVLRRLLDKEGRVEYIYQTPYAGDELIWMKCGAYVLTRREGRVETAMIGISRVDSLQRARLELAEQVEAQKNELAQELGIIEGLAGEFDILHFMSLEDGMFVPHFRHEGVPEELMHIVGTGKSWREAFVTANTQYYHPDDLPFIMQFADKNVIREVLKNQTRYGVRVRLKIGREDGEYAWWEFVLIKLAEKNGEVSNIAMGYINIDAQVRKELEVQEQLKLAAESRKVIENFAVRYDIAFKGNLTTGAFSLLKEDPKFSIGEFKTAHMADAIAVFIDRFVYPKDKERMRREMTIETIRDRLNRVPSYSVEFRLLRDGVGIWHEMAVTAMGGGEIAMGFIERDAEILHSRIKEATLANYEAIYVANLATDQVKILKASRFSQDKPAVVPHAGILKEFAAGLMPEAKKYFEQISDTVYLKNLLKTDGRTEYLYQSPYFGPKPVWMKCEIIVLSWDGDEPETVMFGLTKIDSVQRERLDLIAQVARQKEELAHEVAAIEGLAGEFDVVHFVTLDEDKFTTFSARENVPDILACRGTGTDNWRRALKEGNTALVHPNDLAEMMRFTDKAYVRKVLKNANRRAQRIRLYSAGADYQWWEFIVIKLAEENGIASRVAVCYINIDKQVRKEIKVQEQLKNAEQTRALLENFAGRYQIAYRVHMPDATCVNLKSLTASPDKPARGLAFTDYNEAREYFIEHLVYAPDKELMRRALDINDIREKVKKWPSYSIEYRSEVNGVAAWHELAITAVGKDDVTIGFSEKDTAILNVHMREALMDNYEGIYVINLDADQMKIIKTAGKIHETPEVVPYSKQVKKFASKLFGDAKKYFEEFADCGRLKEQLQKDGKMEYTYLSPYAGDELVWVQNETYVLTWNGDMPQTAMFGITRVDSAQREKIKLNEEIARQKEELEQQHIKLSKALTATREEVHRSDAIHNMIHSGKWSFAIDAGGNLGLPDYSDEFRAIINNEVEGDQYGWSRLIHPEDKEEVVAEFDAALADHTCKTPFDATYRMADKNGEYHWFHSAGRVVRRGDGTGEFFGIHINITDQIEQQLEQQNVLENALSMAQSASRAKTTFLNNMSHDIRTPMNAIIGFTGLAASHIDNKELVQDYLAKISQSSAHLLSLINDVLDMSRIESGKIALEERQENISEIMHTLRNIVLADVNSKQLDFFIDSVDVNDEDIICDKLRLNQALLNVLSNAVKYTPARGTVSLRVTEKTVHNGYADYEFCIKDNGIGMSKEFLATIFEPFTRVRSSTVSGIQGTGLGMAITKNIVDMLGGEIRIESEENKGTEVTLCFEFKLATEAKEPVVIAELEGLRGLVADDDTNTCLSVYKMLKSIGMRAEWCTSGKEAVFRAQAAYQEGDLFRVYILDWLMPDMNGIETARRIRKAIGDDVPIIILTAYDWTDIEEEAREAGVTAFVSKPMFPSDLHRVLNQCLGHEQPAPAAAASPAEVKEGEYNFAGKKILLVEDNELNREIATDILEEAGFEITQAEDGDIAVEKMKNAKEGDFDLVLMDIQMPTMDGYEATRQIRAMDTPISKIPILAMTANAFAEDRAAAFAAGMNEHIPKPIDVVKLKATLARFL
ncbi:MAG TPA: response regulator [Methanocorpusculum sp.]|nr:response regulator [Methanocorpusculum sp.]